MRQPVMLEKRNEHLKFCEEARKLIETVTKRPMIDLSLNPKDLTQVSFVIFGEIVLIASHVGLLHNKHNETPNRQFILASLQERLWKSHVIANTRVSYNEKELLQLIHDHLVKKGLQSTAAQLVAEAELPEVPASKAATTPARLPPLVSNVCFDLI